MADYQITPKALADLDEVWSYIAQHNTSAADQMIDALIQRFSLLGKNPEMGQSREDLAPNLRTFSVRSYVIYFQKSLVTVEIVRVIHGARQSEPLF